MELTEEENEIKKIILKLLPKKIESKTDSGNDSTVVIGDDKASGSNKKQENQSLKLTIGFTNALPGNDNKKSVVLTKIRIEVKNYCSEVFKEDYSVENLDYTGSPIETIKFIYALQNVSNEENLIYNIKSHLESWLIEDS